MPQTIEINISDLQNLIRHIDDQRRDLDLLKQEIVALLPFFEPRKCVLVDPLNGQEFKKGGKHG